MKPAFCTFTCLASLMGVLGCGADVARQDDGKQNERKGFQTREFVDDSGEKHRFVLFVPHAYRPGCKPPVLLFLNGLGENGDDGVRQISNNFGIQIWESREFFPFLAIAPQCRTDGSWDAGSMDTKWALQILDHVIREFDADDDRVYLTGVSAGGSGVWKFASAFPERFAAIVPLCGAHGAEPAALAKSHVAIWNFYNEQDQKELVEFNRSTRGKLLELGCSPIVTEYPVAGHDCWNRAYRTAALYEWLLDQRRSRNRASSLFTPIPAQRLVADWRSQTGTWTVDNHGCLIGHGSARGERGALVSNVATTSIEFHADAWLSDSGIDFGLIRDDDADERPCRISIVSASAGTGGLVSLDGRWIARLDAASQQSLQMDAWNDVRVRLADDRLSLHVNGWKAMDVNLGDAGANAEKSTPPPPYRLAFLASDERNDCRWRHIRLRIAESPQSPSGGSK